MAHASTDLIAALVLLVVVLAVFSYAVPQFGDVGQWLFDVPWGAEEGSIAVRLTTNLADTRKEVYLGEKIWLAFQIKTPHSPCPLSIRVIDLDTGGVVVDKSTVLNVCGGQAFSGTYWIAIIPDFRIVEPVYEGRRYKIEVRAGGEYGAFTFTERHNPIATITALTVMSGGKVVAKLKAGEPHVVKVRLKNNGEADYEFKVRLYVDGNLVNETSVWVLSRREGDASLGFRPTGVGSVNITVVVGGVVDTDRQSVVMDVVYPYPKFVVVEPSAISATVGEEYSGTLRLRNIGELCPNAVLETKGGLFINYKPASVPPGGDLIASIRITPSEAAVGNFTVIVYCGDYKDVVYIPYKFYAFVRVFVRDDKGKPAPAEPVIAGQGRAEARLGPGEYVVEVPPYIDVSPGARYAFERWSDGVASPTRRIRLGGNAQLEAVYRLQYKITLWSGGSVVFDGWVKEGEAVRPGIPQVLQISAVEREVFVKWEGSGCPGGLEFVATAPAECRAVYRREFFVKVVDPLGRYNRSGWYSDFSLSVPAELEEGGVRYTLKGSNCPVRREGGFALLNAAGPAECRLEWSREFRVKIDPGEGSPTWEGWLQEGSEIEYRSGGDYVRASASGLLVPSVVERGDTRLVAKGWNCSDVRVVVDKPLVCVGLWDREYRLRVVVVVGGAVRTSRDIWAKGEVELRAADFAPQPGFLETVSFAGWQIGGRLERGESIRVMPPAEVQAVYESFNWTPVVGAAGAGAVAVVAAIKRLRRPRVELEEVESTVTR